MIFSLWLGNTNEMCRLCFESWLNVGYTPTIFVDKDNMDEFFVDKDFILRDYKEILDIEIEQLYQFTDYFRFKKLYEEGGTWLDADIFLLRPLPNQEIIISTERTCQKGAFKNSIKEIADIGVLRFPQGDPLLEDLLKWIKNNKSKSKKGQKNMFRFQHLIHKSGKWESYAKWLSRSRDYIAINWSNVQELYNGKPLRSKYAKEIDSFEDIKKHSFGIHLWQNLTYNKYKIDFSKNHPDCIFNQLKSYHQEQDYTICIPSFQRPEMLKETTLKLLEDNKITNKIIIFLKDEVEKELYKDIKYEKVITNVKGIGSTRTFIRKYFPTGKKIIMIDDDIKDIKSTRLNFNLSDFFKLMFTTMYLEDVKFAGCCPYDNIFYMTKGYSTNLKYTGGHLIAEIIRENPITVEEEHFEDYIANIEYFKLDKKLLRFNDVYVKTRYYNQNGGIVASYGSLKKRKEDAERLAKELEKKYMGYCSAYFKKKFKVYNLKLKNIKKPIEP